MVSQDMNLELTIIPSVDEVRNVVFSFEGNKVPGPDGFPLFFFQKFWHIILSDVVAAAQDFFQSHSLLKELNATFFVLSPRNLMLALFRILDLLVFAILYIKFSPKSR